MQFDISWKVFALILIIAIGRYGERILLSLGFMKGKIESSIESGLKKAGIKRDWFRGFKRGFK